MKLSLKVMKEDISVIIKYGQYQNGQTAIRLIDQYDFSPICTATVAINEVLDQDEVAIKDYSENEGVLQSLIAAKVVSEPIRFRNQGFVRIPICKLLKSKI